MMLLLRRILPLIAAGAVTSAFAAPQPLPPAPERPAAGTGPTQVEVAAWFTDILRIDSAAQTFAVNLALVLQWQDPSLAVAPGTPPRTFSLDDIWSPRWLVANPALPLQKALPDIATVTANGTVTARQVVLATLSQPMNLRRFPFDQEVFGIKLLVPGYRSEDLALVPLRRAELAGLAEAVGRAAPLTMQDWNVTGLHAGAAPYRISAGDSVAGYTVSFTAARIPNHYVLKVILPLVLIVMMSWCVFWIDPSMGASQISVAVTSMLTLIAYRFAIGADVPKLPYLTLLDAFILISSILVFLSLIEVMITTTLALTNRLEAGRALDRHCRWIFPLLFVTASASLIFF